MTTQECPLTPAAAASGDGWMPVALLADVQRSGLLGVSVEGVDLVLVCRQGEVRAFDGRCPHQGTLLGEGEVKDGKLICRAHQWQFDCLSGQKVGDPTTCLRSHPVRIDGERVLVNRATPAPQPLPAPPGTPVAKLPCPPGLPLIGNLHQLKRSAFHQTLESWAEQYGPIYAFRGVRGRIAVVSDANLANALLKARPDDFRRTSQLERVSILGLSSKGIFMAEGDAWRKQRPIIMQSLDTRHLRQFFPTLAKVAERLQRRWQRTGETSGGLDVQADLMRFTVDVTTSLAFGQDMNTLEQEGAVIQEHLDKIFPTIQRRLLSPLPYWRYIKTARDRDVEQSVHKVYETIAGFLANGRAQLAARPELREHPENLLQSLLVAFADGGAGDDSAGATGKQFSEKEVTDNVLTMLLAGEDTTANSLAWVLYYLAKYPEVQDRLRVEVDAVLAGEPLTEFEKTRQFPYVDALINETMRLKPVAPINILEANRDVTVGPLALRKGELVAILSRAIALREADFSAAKRFNPERWLRVGDDDPQPGGRQVNTRAFMPFGSGPRLCPGRSLALLEMKTALVMIAQHFTVAAAADIDQVNERLQFTMSPQGLRIHFHPRLMPAPTDASRLPDNQ